MIKKISIIIISILIISVIVLFFKFSRKAQNQDFDFRIQKYKLGEVEVNLKIADSPQKRQKGLSKIYKLPEKDGIIFIFEKPSILSFWNKDTFLDLDVVWIQGGVVVGMSQLQKEKSGRMNVYSPVSCNVAIELNQGFC